MSRSPYFFVERLNRNTGKYEFQHPTIWNWDHTKQEAADLFPYNGCHDLFSIVEDNDCDDNFPHMRGIHQGLPGDACEEIVKNFKDCTWEAYSGEMHTYEPDARWFTYADMYIYCLEHPTVPDYEAMDKISYNAREDEKVETITMQNPLNTLMNRVNAFLEVMDGWDWQDDYSQIRIVYWID